MQNYVSEKSARPLSAHSTNRRDARFARPRSAPLRTDSPLSSSVSPSPSPPRFRPLSAAPQRSVQQKKPMVQSRPASAHSPTASLSQSMSESFTEKILRGRPSSAHGVRSRNPSIRTPKVKLYRNGQRIDGTGAPYHVALSLSEVLCDASRILNFPFSAKAMFSDRGEPIEDIGQFHENMNVVVTMGERFKFKTYLSTDDFEALPRTCKYCKRSYSYMDNSPVSCLRHPLAYANGKWLCCSSTSRSAMGCTMGYHADPMYDDNLNVLPSKKCVVAVINGHPFGPGREILVDIPSKLEVLLENCSRRLRMVRFATKLYTEKGAPITSISDVRDGMRVVVSTGESFRWGVYLTREEIMITPRRCHRCKKTYIGTMNRPNACVFHPMEYNAAMGGKPSRQVIIRFDNIHKTYLLGVEGVPALRGVSVDIFEGEFVVVYGTSGGGKTTLLNIIGTIDTPTKGELFVDGHRINSSTEDSILAELRLRSLGFVFQSFNLISSMSALENVELPMILNGKLTPGERRERAISLLESVGMGSRLGHLPSQLSGGEQQRVTIARALANKPKILLLDEPTGDLDSKNTKMVMNMLRSLNQEQGITMIMVTHDRSLKNIAHRVIWMRDGKISHIETIENQKREEMYRLLQDQIQVRVESNTSQIAPPSNRTKTQVRNPNFYAPVRYQKKLPSQSSLDVPRVPQVQENAGTSEVDEPPSGANSNINSIDADIVVDASFSGQQSPS